MTTKTNFSVSKAVCIMLLGCITTLTASAQFLRTSFLMSDHHSRLKLNPAMTPGSGFVDIPVIGNFDFTASSNVLGMKDILDAFSGSDGNFTSDALYNRLSDLNKMNLAFNTDAISAGWWRGNHFWSVNVGLHFDAGARIPKSMFTFLRDCEDKTMAEDWSNYSQTVTKENINLNAWSDIGVGYAHVVNDKLTVGGRVKFILGMANLDMAIDRLDIETTGLTNDIEKPESWTDGGYAQISVKAKLESSLAGMKLLKNKDGVINDYEFGNYGIAGYGGAVDLGVTYQAIDGLTFSAAVNDLGFISWSKNSTNTMTSQTERYYNIDNYQEFVDIAEGGNLINLDLYGFKHEEQSASRVTSLYSTITAGVEYSFLGDMLAVGALSTTRFVKPETQSELTLSAAARPLKWLNVAVSYSPILSNGNSFGAAVKLGPVFAGTDYIYLGKNTRICNAFAGITIPLGSRD